MKALSRKSISDPETRVSRTIGWSLLAMFLLGFFAEFAVRVRLINWKDPGLTFQNIHDSLLMFEAGILAFIAILILDVVLSVSFYVLLSPINRFIGLIMMIFRLVYVAIKGFAIVGLVLARDLILFSSQADSGLIGAHVAQTMRFLKMHDYGFGIGLIFFGLHLIGLAVLLIKSKAVKKGIAWLILLAGIGYCLNSFLSLFAGNQYDLKIIIIAVFIIPMTFSELILGVWLWRNGERNHFTFQ
jgi:hypothetical protein